jgi:hypothetical protein
MDEYFLPRDQYDSDVNLYFLQEIATNGREVRTISLLEWHSG